MIIPDILVHIFSYLCCFDKIVFTNKYFYSVWQNNIHHFFHLSQNPNVNPNITKLIYCGTDELRKLPPNLEILEVKSNYKFLIQLQTSLKRIYFGKSPIWDWNSEYHTGLTHIDFGDIRRIMFQVGVTPLPSTLVYLGCHYSNLYKFPSSVTQLVLYGQYADINNSIKYRHVSLNSKMYDNIKELTINFHVIEFPKNVSKLTIHNVRYDELIIPKSVTELCFKRLCYGNIILHPNIKRLVLDAETLDSSILIIGTGKQKRLSFRNLDFTNTQIILKNTRGNMNYYFIAFLHNDYVSFVGSNSLNSVNKNNGVYYYARIELNPTFIKLT